VSGRGHKLKYNGKRSCRVKVPHRTIEGAFVHADAISTEHKPYGVFCCEWCGFFHVANAESMRANAWRRWRAISRPEEASA
jgi:hypothetical protein